MGNRTPVIRITAGAVAVLFLILLLLSLPLYLRLSGKTPLDLIFPERVSRAVYPIRQGMEDLARLDCAEYRIRTVYPYDFPELAADPGIRIRNLEFCIWENRSSPP